MKTQKQTKLTRYISILRGINVSGRKTIKMDMLKKMYENLNFDDVLTYVQSGNVIFSSQHSDLKELEKMISSEIKSVFGFDVPVIVLNSKTLEKIIENNPFSKDSDKDISSLYITFLADSPTEFDKESIIIKKQQDEEIEFGSNVIYLYCPHGYGKTKLNNNFLESKLKITASTRNWKTANELLKSANRYR